MTAPTQAQIEAAGVAYWNYWRQQSGHKPEASFKLDEGFAEAIAAALTAAAQVEEAVNYRELLLKYICHVGDEEGIDFIRSRSRPSYITEEEWGELEKMSFESEKFHVEMEKRK